MITAKIPRFGYNDTAILQNIAISFECGKTHGVVGLNGAGKTTFFNLLAGYLKDSNCEFLLNDKAILHQQMAFIDTDLFFYPKLTGAEFLSVFPKSSEGYNEEKLALLFKLPLNAFVEEYSTGMKKKLLLLSQIKQDKEIFILDEPFNGLDLETNKILEVIISILNERGKTVFISSHILEPLLNICFKIHYLKNAEIFKSYHQNEFGLIEQELFGQYSQSVKEELSKII
ncbi:MAG: ATP-binding cassette domain-containing protein [Bacteroidia bacterium]|nr:ATP-binding cassette domain-containing protein [Bacteroidia bacterium]